ncbi:hypothetical protein CRUP_001136 [Coryphaenoides rupestris]|nr:hypothetical protein CRUP_001136 [Coryphaenoides rupestris]
MLNEELTSLADEAQSLKDEMEVLRHSTDKVSKLEGTVEYYKKKLGDANRRTNELETENRLINQRGIEGQGQVEELQKDLQEQALKADDATILKKKNQEYMDKLRELNDDLLNDELLKKSAYIDDLEPEYNTNTQRVDELEEALKRKDHKSMQDMNRLLKQLEELNSKIDEIQSLHGSLTEALVSKEWVKQRVLQVLDATQHSIPKEVPQINREEEVQVSRDEMMQTNREEVQLYPEQPQSFQECPLHRITDRNRKARNPPVSRPTMTCLDIPDKSPIPPSIYSSAPSIHHPSVCPSVSWWQGTAQPSRRETLSRTSSWDKEAFSNPNTK